MAGKDFIKPGAERADLEVAWQDRLADAQALLSAGRHAAAIATSVYALEIRLKVSICKRLDLPNLPAAFEVHDLDSLLLLAGLSRRLERKRSGHVKTQWEVVKKAAAVLNDLRYKPASNWNAAQATAVWTALNDPATGVLQWLSKQR